jgi:hypothetical protein
MNNTSFAHMLHTSWAESKMYRYCFTLQSFFPKCMEAPMAVNFVYWTGQQIRSCMYFKPLQFCNIIPETVMLTLWTTKNIRTLYHIWPVTVAERSEACTVFARSEAGTVGSNPTEGMHV